MLDKMSQIHDKMDIFQCFLNCFTVPHCTSRKILTQKNAVGSFLMIAFLIR